MAENITLSAQTRTELGSANSRRMRRTGMVPAILGTSKGKTMPIQFERHSFEQMLAHHHSESLIVDLAVDGKKARKVLLKEVQHHVITDHVQHADFVEVSMTEKMRVTVPLTLVGEPVGVTQDGGVLEHLVRDVEVECLPGDLVEEFKVDVSGMQIGDSVAIQDLELGSKFDVLTDGSIAVASVAPPRLAEEPAEGEEEGAEGDEPEVIGEKKEASDGDASEE